MNWYMKLSAVRYRTRRSGLLARICQAIACIRWVLPRPTPPYRNSGLKGASPASLARWQAAAASSLDLPTTKFPKVKRGSSGAETLSSQTSEDPLAPSGSPGIAGAGSRDGASARAGRTAKTTASAGDGSASRQSSRMRAP